MSAKMIYETEGLRFTWEGGAYIDIGPEGTDSALDCINVWDYAEDKPTITFDKLEETCNEWLRDQEEYQ